MDSYIKKFDFSSSPDVGQHAVQFSESVPPIQWGDPAQNSTQEDKFFSVDARLVSTGLYTPGKTGS
jgi:hypothetical protein